MANLTQSQFITSFNPDVTDTDIVNNDQNLNNQADIDWYNDAIEMHMRPNINYNEEIQNKLKENDRGDDARNYALFLNFLYTDNKLMKRVVFNLTNNILRRCYFGKNDNFKFTEHVTRDIMLRPGNQIFIDKDVDSFIKEQYLFQYGPMQITNDEYETIENYILNFLPYHLNRCYFNNPIMTECINFICSIFETLDLGSILNTDDSVYTHQYAEFLTFVKNVNTISNSIGTIVYLSNPGTDSDDQGYGDFNGEGGFNIKDAIVSASKKYKFDFPKSIVEMYCSKYITTKLSNNPDNLNSNQLIDILTTHLNKPNTNLKIERYVSDLKNVVQSLQSNARKYKFNNSEDEE